jgi:hypothetical protein
MTSENFFYKYSKGQLDDSADFIEWVNGYQHYLLLRLEIARQIAPLRTDGNEYIEISIQAKK